MWNTDILSQVFQAVCPSFRQSPPFFSHLGLPHATFAMQKAAPCSFPPADAHPTSALCRDKVRISKISKITGGSCLGEKRLCFVSLRSTWCFPISACVTGQMASLWHKFDSYQHLSAALAASPISKPQRSSRRLSTKCQRVVVTQMTTHTINSWFRRGGVWGVTNSLCFFYSRRKKGNLWYFRCQGVCVVFSSCQLTWKLIPVFIRSRQLFQLLFLGCNSNTSSAWVSKCAIQV